MTKTRRIRIGNQTAFSAPSITLPFRYAVAKGFDAFEWFPDKKESGQGWSEIDIGKVTRGLIKKIAIKHDIALSVHAPLLEDSLEQVSLEIFLRHVGFAQDLGATLFNIHLDIEKGLDAYIQSIIPLAEQLAKIKISLAIENTPLTGPDTFNELFKRLHDIFPKDTARIGMCLDPGHANLCRETLNDYLRFMDMLDPHIPIIHVHMHENHGDHDSHLPLFTGPAKNDASGIRGLLDRLNKRGFSGAIIMEQWPMPPSLLDEARNRLFEMINYE